MQDDDFCCVSSVSKSLVGLHVCACVCICVYVSKIVCVHVGGCMYVCASVCIYVCICVCMCSVCGVCTARTLTLLLLAQVGALETAAINDLMSKIYTVREELQDCFKKIDTENRGLITVAQWADCNVS